MAYNEGDNNNGKNATYLVSLGQALKTPGIFVHTCEQPPLD